MNPSELRKLIDSHLAGAAGQQDIERLDALLRENPDALCELLDAAAMEVGLRRVLARVQAFDHASDKTHAQPRQPVWRAAAAAWKVAAVLIIGLAGWGVTARYAQRYGEATAALSDANRQLADLRAIQRQNPLAAIGVIAKEPEIVSTRGWVRLLPANEDFSQSVVVGVGTRIPVDRKMWTCPWGGASARFPDGTAVSLDRSTLATFKEVNGLRQIDIKKGIVSVTQRPATSTGGRMVVTSDQGTVTFETAEVTMAVMGEQTLVEVAGGKATYTRVSDGRTIELGANQYAVIGSGKEFAAVTGSLQWRIGPEGTPGGI